MANPFEMLEQLRAFRDQSADLLATTDPTWLMRAGAARFLEFTLQAALDAGPPDDFARSLNIDEPQAAILYERVLRAALRRTHERAFARREVAINARL